MLESLNTALLTIDKSKCVAPVVFLEPYKEVTRVVSAAPTTGAVITCIVPHKIPGLTKTISLEKATLASAIIGRPKATLKAAEDHLLISDGSYKMRISSLEADKAPELQKPEGNPTLKISGKNAKALVTLINQCGIERVHESQPDPNVLITGTAKATEITAFDTMQLCNVKSKPVFDSSVSFVAPLPSIQTVLSLPFQEARMWILPEAITVLTSTWSIRIPSLAEGIASGSEVADKTKAILAMKTKSTVAMPVEAANQFLANTQGIYQTGALYNFEVTPKGLTVAIDGAKGDSKAMLGKVDAKPIKFSLHRSFLTFVLSKQTDGVASVSISDSIAILKGENILYVAMLSGE